MWAVAFLITVLRLIVRYLHKKRLFWDDAFAIAAIVGLTAMAILNQTSCDAIYLIDVIAAGGTPGPSFTSQEIIFSTIIAQRYMQFFFMMLFWTTLWSVKGSLMMFYRRLVVGVDGYMTWWWVVVAFSIITYLISIMTNILDCIPLRRRFSLDPKGGLKSTSLEDKLMCYQTLVILLALLTPSGLRPASTLRPTF